MITWLATPVLAAAPPNVDLDDVFAWDEAANHALAGPGGCWEVRATAVRKFVVVVPPDAWTPASQLEEVSEATISGRLEDGVWTRWRVFETAIPKPSNLYLRIMPRVTTRLEVVPLTGHYASGAASNLVREIVEDLGGAVSTSVAEWDDDLEGVWLRRQVPVHKRPRSPLTDFDAFFPGGADRWTKLDVTFPESFRGGSVGFRFKLTDAQIHMRTRDGLPTVENVSSLIYILGITMGYEQSLTYTSWTPCAER